MPFALRQLSIDAVASDGKAVSLGPRARRAPTRQINEGAADVEDGIAPAGGVLALSEPKTTGHQIPLYYREPFCGTHSAEIVGAAQEEIHAVCDMR